MIPTTIDAVETRPRVYLIGFPKAGLHMVEQAVSAFAAPVAEKNWFGTSAWTTDINNGHLFFGAMAAIPAGAYAKGHAAYLPYFEQVLFSLGIATVFIYRDLRDIAVSQAYHILRSVNDPERLKHPFPERYLACESVEDVIELVIKGIDGEHKTGLFDRWTLYAGWLKAQWVYKVRYEGLRHGLPEDCAGLLRYCMASVNAQLDEAYPYPKQQVEYLAYEMSDRILNRAQAQTFRKGKSGEWKKHFTKRLKKLWKKLDPGWLVTLGYEKDNHW